MSNSNQSHHHSRKPKSGDSRRDGSSWSSKSNFRNDTYHSNQHTSSYYGRANVNQESNLPQNSRYEYAPSSTNNSSMTHQQQQQQKKARSDPVISAVQPQPEYFPIAIVTNGDSSDSLAAQSAPMAILEAVKVYVDVYLGNLCKETWNDYEWECKLITQIPDFVRIYKEVPSGNSSKDPMDDARQLSIEAMKGQFWKFVPPSFLTYEPTLWQEKLDAARHTISFLEQILRDMDQAEFNRKRENKQYMDEDDDDDDYIDPYWGDPMYGDGEDSDQDPSELPSSFYNKYIDEIRSFFQAMPFNLVFNAGFHYPGVSTEDDEKCYCPCSWKMKAWQTQFHLDGICMGDRGKKVEYCSDNKFLHHALMSHLEKIGERDDLLGLIHRGIHKYIHLLYKKFNNGLGHKALFKVADENYKKIEIYEKKKMNDLIQELQKKVGLEESKRLESEQLLKDMELKLKESGLQELNKDKFDEINALSKTFRDLNFPISVQKKRSAQELSMYQNQIDSIFRAIRSCSTKNQEVTLKIPFDFSLQAVMDQWYQDPSKDVLFLFQDYSYKGDVSKFLAEWNIEFFIPDFHDNSKNRKSKLAQEMEFDTKAIDKGGPTAQFLNAFWRQVGDLAISVHVDGKCHKTQLFENEKKGIVPCPEDKLMNGKIDEPLLKATLKVSRVWFRAIGRVMIHSLMGSKHQDSHKQFPLPVHVIPRFFRSSVLSGCDCSDMKYYPWAEVVADLHYIDLKGVIPQNRQDIAPIFEYEIPACVLEPRKAALSALREGISIGGILDFAGNLLKNAPIHVQRDFEFTKDQLDGMTEAPPCSLTPYFKSIPLDVLDSLLFCKSSVELEDIMRILRVTFWTYWENLNQDVPAFTIEHQKLIWKQLGSVLDECEREKDGFLVEFLEFFTGYSFLPESIESEVMDTQEYPAPDKNTKFQLTIEFNGDQMSVDSDGYGDLPVAHTCDKVMRLPGTAYNGDVKLFKKKLLTTLSSIPRGYFDQN